MSETPPLPPSTRRLLDAERLRDELPESGVDEAWQAFASRLAAIPSAVPHPVAPVREGAGEVSRGARLLKVGGALLVAFGVGVATGRVLPRDADVSPPTVESARPTPSASAPVELPATSVSTVPTPEREPERRPLPMAARSAAPPLPQTSAASPRATASAADPLADERALIEGARTALLRGRPTDALELARRHEARFPDGELSEDRDFMVVSALSELGRPDEARASARRFLARYPKSALRKTVERWAL